MVGVGHCACTVQDLNLCPLLVVTNTWMRNMTQTASVNICRGGNCWHYSNYLLILPPMIRNRSPSTGENHRIWHRVKRYFEFLAITNWRFIHSHTTITSMDGYHLHGRITPRWPAYFRHQNSRDWNWGNFTIICLSDVFFRVRKWDSKKLCGILISKKISKIALLNSVQISYLDKGQIWTLNVTSEHRMSVWDRWFYAISWSELISYTPSRGFPLCSDVFHVICQHSQQFSCSGMQKGEFNSLNCRNDAFSACWAPFTFPSRFAI